MTLTGITRQWSSFSQAAGEVIDARVYSGIHFRTADEVGARLGRQVARFVSTHALRRCPGAGPNVTKTSGGHRARDDRVQPREDKTLRLRLPRGAALQSSSLKRPVPGLSGRDFRIRDEGRPLELEFFDG